jgi:hypothetical protein
MKQSFVQDEGFTGRDYISASRLEVFGAVPNALPSGSLTATPATAAPGQAVTLDASSFKDPDSLITGYDWDFDGNGSVDRSTTGRRRRSPTRARHVHPEGRGEGLPRRRGDGLDDRDGRRPSRRPRRRALPKITLAKSGKKGSYTLRVKCAERAS